MEICLLGSQLHPKQLQLKHFAHAIESATAGLRVVADSQDEGSIVKSKLYSVVQQASEAILKSPGEIRAKMAEDQSQRALDEAGKARKELVEAKEVITTNLKETTRLNNLLSEAKATLAPLTKQLTNVSEKLKQAEKTVDKQQTELSSQKKELSVVQKTLKNVQDDLALRKVELQEKTQKLAVSEGRLLIVRANLNASEKQLTEAKANLNSANNKLTKAHKDIEQLRVQVANHKEGLFSLAKRALIVAEAPVGAEIYVEKFGAVAGQYPAVFLLPPLDSGKSYEYTLRMDIIRQGKKASERRKVVVKPFTEVTVSFLEGGNQPPKVEPLSNRSIVVAEVPPGFELYINDTRHPVTDQVVREFVSPLHKSGQVHIFDLRVLGVGESGRTVDMVKRVSSRAGEVIAVSFLVR